MLSGDEIERKTSGMSDASTSAVQARQKLEFVFLENVDDAVRIAIDPSAAREPPVKAALADV